MIAKEVGPFPNLIYPPDHLQQNAFIKSMDQYERMYRESTENPDKFWGDLAGSFLDWDRKWDSVFSWQDRSEARFRWFDGGKLNASYNCLDRHLTGPRKNKAAIIWEGDNPSEQRTLTYQDLYREVNRFANVLLKHGIVKGDRVALYLPMIPELPIAMLACARIGAIHSVIFGGFSAEPLRDRLNDTQAKMLVTSDGGYRGGKTIPLKEAADNAAGLTNVETMIVVRRTGDPVPMMPGRDYYWHTEMADPTLPAYCPPESMDAEDPMFILYTSGSTGKPKGVVHTTAGYLLHTAVSHKWVFDIREEDTFWCTADIGWITGHSYIVYGPLVNGATTVMFEGVPSYPDPDRFWSIIAKYQVNQFYTAPTAIRSLMREGDDWVKKHDLQSLRILGTVGEPINPEAWLWYYELVGGKRCPVIDTYWQTETGGFLITPFPGATPLLPGSATRPFFGIKLSIQHEDGSPCVPNENGYLVIEQPWPGMMRTVYKDHRRFVDTYWSKFPGHYATGDGAYIDDNGYVRIIGRLDDVINVSGHRLGTAEVESALDSHFAVAEAAVVGMPHDVKGQGIYAFVTLKAGMAPSDELKKDLIKAVRKEIGPIASPDCIQFTNGLPKTRSGKIMRRILEKIATGKTESLGDTSTLADPSVVDSIITGRDDMKP